MLESLVNTVTNFQFTSAMGFALYWVPVAVCLIGYAFWAMKLYREDLRLHRNLKYFPQLTVGWILARIIVSFIPVVNLFTAVFKFLPLILQNFFEWMADVFSFPIVQPRPKENNQDENRR